MAAYNDAVDKYNAGDMEGAMAKAEEANKLGPDKVNGWDLTLKLAVNKKDWDKVILAGEKLPTTTAERREIMRRWLASGRTESSLCERMGWKASRYTPRREEVA